MSKTEMGLIPATRLLLQQRDHIIKQQEMAEAFLINKVTMPKFIHRVTKDKIIVKKPHPKKGTGYGKRKVRSLTSPINSRMTFLVGELANDTQLQARP